MENVLVISPNWRDLGKIGRLAKHNPHPALEMMYITASLNKERIKNKVLDLWGENKSLGDYSEDIRNSDIAVIDTAPSYTFWRDGTLDAELSKIEIAKIKKINPGIKVIVVGPHGTVLPHTFFDTEADYVLRGEPDLEAVKLIKEIRNNQETKLASVCFKRNGLWITGKEKANVNNMEDLPILEYENIKFENYCWPKLNFGDYKKTMVYETSRGCPYNCTFCFREGFRGKLRKKSIEQIGRELDKIRGKVDYVYLIDEIFGIDKEWGKSVSVELNKRRIKWGCETRPECLNKDLMDAMINNGCIIIQLGLESANKEVLKAMNKVTLNINKLRENVNYAIGKGAHIKLYLTAGSSKETKESLRETLDYILQFDLDKVNAAINIMIPYPETLLWYEGRKEGKKLEDWEDIPANMGIIGNIFSKPDEVMKEVAKFNAEILRKKAVVQIKNSFRRGNMFRMTKFATVYGGCAVLLVFPGLFNFFYKFYRFV